MDELRTMPSEPVASGPKEISSTLDAAPQSAGVDEQPWLPDPIPAERFSNGDGWANINRSPHDRVSGVVFKRAPAIKSVRCTPELGAASMSVAGKPAQGEMVVRWLFSETPGTQEGLLSGRTFGHLQDLTLDPAAGTVHEAHPGLDTLLVVIEGRGMLRHRPTPGSPIIVRPLRPGDAALIAEAELFDVENVDAAAPLRIILLGLVTHG